MKKTIMLLLAMILLAGCSSVRPAEPKDDYSDEMLKEHGLEVIQSDVKLDFSKRIINAVEINYSDKEGDGRGYVLIDDAFESYVAVFDWMFEEGNYYPQMLEFEPVGIIASVLVDEDYTEYRQMALLPEEMITVFIAYDDFDIMNNVTSYDLGFADDEYRSKFFLTLKKDNKVYLQSAEAEEMLGDFQSIRLIDEYPVFETEEKIERLYASGDVLDQRIWENSSAIVMTEKSIYLGFLKDGEYEFNRLEYLSGLRERIHFIAIDRDDVTIVLTDGKVLRGNSGKLN